MPNIHNDPEDDDVPAEGRTPFSLISRVGKVHSDHEEVTGDAVRVKLDCGHTKLLPADPLPQMGDTVRCTKCLALGGG